MLTPADMPPGYVLVVSTPTEVRIEDVDTDAFFVDAWLEEHGRLKFLIETVDEQSGTRGTVRGAVLFELMMRHFGDAIQTIRSEWTDGSNLREFNRLTSLGYSDEVAAKETWTGRQAAKYGFVTVAVDHKLGAGAGSYGLVETTFAKRPEESRC